MDVVEHILGTYNNLRYTPPKGTWTVLAAFYLLNETSGECEIISMATGTKCLDISKYSQNGDSLHDCHAEAVARRGAKRWFMEELDRSLSSPSRWLDRHNQQYDLREGVILNMYISTLPCTPNHFVSKSASSSTGQVVIHRCGCWLCFKIPTWL